MAAILVYAVVFMLNGCRQATLDMTEFGYGLDNYYFHFAISIGAFISVFSSMFLGTEYSDGTIRNKVIVGHTRLLLFLGLFLFANMIYNSLSQPEMTSSIVITANGIDMSEPAPNPNYVSGMTRAVYEFILDFLPTGQGALMAFLEIANPVRMILSSVFITVSVTLCGIFFFRRKNLK